MNPADEIRSSIATQLMHSLKHNGTTYTELAEQLVIPEDKLYHAINYGVVETTDLIILCRELGLCAISTLADATNHQPEAPHAPSSTAEAGHQLGPWRDITDPDHPIPTGRWLQIKCHHISPELHALYLADGDRFQIGHDSIIERKDVTLWRAQPLPVGAQLADARESKGEQA